jgi:hypothetical protein
MKRTLPADPQADAWKQWKSIVKLAWDHGNGNLVAQFAPKPNAPAAKVVGASQALWAAMGRTLVPDHDERLPLPAAGEPGQGSRGTQR